MKRFFDGAPPNALAPPAPVAPPPAPREDMPFVPSVRQVATGLDPLTEQLLFGIRWRGWIHTRRYAGCRKGFL